MRLQFRLSTGHNANDANPATLTSTISKICNGDGSLENAAAQSNFASALSGYLNGLADAGPLVATLCMFLWVSVVIAHVMEALRMLRAILSLPRGPTSVLIQADDQERVSVEFKQISLTRVRPLE